MGAVGTWLCCVLLIGLGVSPAAIAQTTVTYIHTDALGSVVAESDANGNVIKRYDYGPYGAVVGGQVTDGPLVSVRENGVEPPQVLQLSLVLLTHIFRLGAQRVLQAALAVLDPALDLGRGQVELPTGRSHRRLALDDLKGQRRLAPGGSALDLFFHHFAHRCLLREKEHLSRKPVGHYTEAVSPMQAARRGAGSSRRRAKCVDFAQSVHSHWLCDACRCRVGLVSQGFLSELALNVANCYGWVYMFVIGALRKGSEKPLLPISLVTAIFLLTKGDT